MVQCTRLGLASRRLIIITGGVKYGRRVRFKFHQITKMSILWRPLLSAEFTQFWGPLGDVYLPRPEFSGFRGPRARRISTPASVSLLFIKITYKPIQTTFLISQ